MIDYSWRLVKRFAVLLPGIIIAYFSVRDVFPALHKRLPIALAILLTYAFGAYILVPAVIRLVRIVRPPKHLPLYCVTPDGFASDPVNIGIVSSQHRLIRAMTAAGWYQSDPLTIRNLLRHFLSLVFGWSYPAAPVSRLYLFGRKHDIAFERPSDAKFGGRHHVRFWATTYRSDRRLSIGSIHWQPRRRQRGSANILWVGAASLDTGIAPIRHNLQITHTVHPDTNQERNLIVTQLKTAGLVASQSKLRLGPAYQLINRAWWSSLHSDGKMIILTLK